MYVIIIGSVMILGCTAVRETQPDRTATEQLILSHAVIDAVRQIKADAVAGKKVMLDLSYLKTVDIEFTKGELRDRLLNLNTLIGDFRPIIDRNLGDGVEVRTDLADDLWNCRLDPVQCEMALLNILSNARDAMHGKGVVQMKTENLVSTEEEPLAAGLAPGEYACLSIQDQGDGIAEETIDRIFDPFFSTKEVGQGTGLGLSMVYGFVRQSGGGVEARNVPDGGARFTLYFPRARGMVEADHVKLVHEGGGGEHILMVEDQPEVAELGQAILEDMGYAVTHVSSASKAYDLLQRKRDFALLFTDIVMPGGMSGVELARQVRQLIPSLPILLTTGYSDRALDEDSRAFELVRKPYRRADLSAKIRSLLEGPNGIA